MTEENPCIKNKKPIVREKECDGKDGMISGDPIQEGYCINQVCFDKKEIQDLRLTHVRYVPKKGESPHKGPAPIPGDLKGPVDRRIIKGADILAAGIRSPTKDTYDEDYEKRKDDYRRYKVAYLFKPVYKKHKERQKQQSTRRVSPVQPTIRVSPVQPTRRVSPVQPTIRVSTNQSTRRGPSVKSTRRVSTNQSTRRGPSVQPTRRFRDRLNNKIGTPSPSNKLNHIKLDVPNLEFRREYEKTRRRRRAMDSILP